MNFNEHKFGNIFFFVDYAIMIDSHSDLPSVDFQLIV